MKRLKRDNGGSIAINSVVVAGIVDANILADESDSLSSSMLVPTFSNHNMSSNSHAGKRKSGTESE